MRPGAVAGRRHIELAGIRLGIGDEFGDRLRRKRWMHLHAVILVADARNRRDVTDEIVFELLVERRVDRVRYVDQEQRIAIGGYRHPPLLGRLWAGAAPGLAAQVLPQPVALPSPDH